MTNTFEHKKSLGQHFLNSDYVPKQMCDAAGELAGKTVLEIGPGTGVLTKEILARGATVIALEADQRAIASLEADFTDAIDRGQLIIHHHDARDLDPRELSLPADYTVIANIPYYLSGHLFRALLDTTHQPSDLVFLIQKEVAERIARDPKESLLSLSVKLFGNPTYISTIKRTHFTPPPKVDSAILAVRHIGHNKLPSTQEALFFELIHLGFAQKRKQLLGNLSAKFNRSTLHNTFSTIGIGETVRAEDIPLETWLELVSHLQSTPST